MTTTLNRSVGTTVPSSSSASVLGTLSTLVVFDSRVLGLDVLYGALLPEAIGYTIEPNDDALLVITQLLAETGAKQLSIVAHGEPGIVHIGAQPLNLQQITDRSALLQEWCLDEIALYSCEVGADRAFVAGLEGITGAQVDAANQQVGAEALGSNSVFDQDIIKDYPHTLSGTGLTGTYYDNIDFTGTSFTRLDSTINFDFGEGVPIEGIGADTFSVRWSGKIQPLYTETYTFTTSTDDGVKLTINGVELINDPTFHGETPFSGTIDLIAGQQYDIEMEYFDNDQGAVARLSWQSTTQALQIVPQSQLYPVTPPSGTGTGLTGTYYDNIDFTGTSATRLDSVINFDFGEGAPIAGIDVDTFSVRWSGKIQPLYTETYTFTTSTDDGVKLTINGVELINDPTFHGETPFSGTIDLIAGQQYDIEMEYFDNDQGAVARLSWQSANQALQIVPQSQLFPVSLTSPPTATNLSAAEAYTEDTTLNLTDIVITDVDSPVVTATLTLSNIAAGALSTATSGAVTSTFNTGVWTATGAIADVNTLLAGVSFTPALNFDDNFTVATNVSDGVNTAITGTKNFTGTENSVIRHAGDFDGDGKSEILWRNNDGTVAAWALDGTSDFAITSAPTIANAPADWKIADTSDFDGDGKSEILWRNNDGSVAIWKLDGTSAFAIASAPLIADATNAPTNWKISGTGDFDGDGKSEILWRNNDGSVAIWKLDGTSNFTLASAPAIADATSAPTNWKISGTGDFDGDGKSEILWYNNTDGTVAIWKLDGTSAFTLSSAPTVGTAPTNSKIKGIDDLDGDGKSEILWRNNDGSIVVWKLDGTSAFTLASSPVIASAVGAPTDWRTSATGDFNGNGGSEILWRNTSGAVAVWELDGTSSFLPVAAPVIASAASAPADWVIAAPNLGSHPLGVSI